MKNVLAILATDCLHESRVLRQGETLFRNGYDFKVAALNSASLQSDERVSGITIHRMTLRSRTFFDSDGFRQYRSRFPLLKVLQSVVFIEWVVRLSCRFRSIDIVHAYSMIGLAVAVGYKLFHPSVKIIYDAREYETEVTHLSRSRKALRKCFEKWMIKMPVAVLTVSDGISREYVRLYNIPLPFVVLNVPPYRQPKKCNHFRETFGIEKDNIIFLYQGGFCIERNLDVLLRAFASLTSDTKAVCVLMGYGELLPEVQRYAEQYPNIYYHEAVPPEVLLDYTSSADIGLCLIENTCLSHYYCLPNKLFEYWMAGLPVIATDLPEIKKLLETYQTGEMVANNDIKTIASAIAQVTPEKIDLWKKGLDTLNQKYNWAVQEITLLRAYEPH